MSVRALGRAALFSVAVLLLGVPAEAYYHYVYYLTNPVAGYASVLMPARFDLNRLPNNTVTYYVNDSGPAVLAPGDSFGSVLGEVKQALAAWNAVPTSALRISFGGIENSNQFANTPGGRVMFTDLPPGIIGMGTPNLPGIPQMMSYPSSATAAGSQGFFVPISNALVMLTNNTNNGFSSPGPSYLESYFTTTVHEIGHSLGLQHTWTGSAMSQAVIRNTSHARPLDADDIASLSELYGNAGWTANYGSVSGTVQFTSGQPVSLASVVAISATGPAISALTNPDGTYTINGLPPNTYQVYVHPLPPDAISNGEGLKLPESQQGVPYQPSGSFQSQFFPGVLDPNQASSFTITPSNRTFTANFNVTPRNGVPAYDLITYSYLDPNARNYTLSGSNNVTPTPAFLNSTQAESLVYISSAQGVSYPQPAKLTMLGVGNAFQLTPGNGGTFAYFVLSTATGPRHLVFNYGNDIYVLPNAVNLVQQGPPSISSVAGNGDGTVTVSGSNFGPDDRVYFDGMPAASTFNAGQSAFIATPPWGVSGQTSTVTVFDSDSQSSMFPLGVGEPVQPGFQAQSPQTYTYPSYSGAQIQPLQTAALPAGTAGVPYTALVAINGVNTQFVDGQVTVGFGSSDISVSRVWVQSPTQLIANVVVAPGAAVGTSEISVIAGFNVMTAPSPFQILPANPSAPVIGTVINPLNAQALFPGGFGVIYGVNLSGGSNNATVTLSGIPATVEFAGSGQINFVVPPNLPVGPTVLNLNAGSSAISLVVPVGNPPVTIQGASGASGAPVTASSTLGGVTVYYPGDTVTVFVSGLDPTVSSNLSRVQVTVSGIAMPVTSAGNGQVQFALTQSFGGAQVPVVVSVDGSASAPYTIAVR